jgi:hypothetical protein
MVALATQRNHARLLGPAPSGGRLDVLVDPEQIGRIIFALHGKPDIHVIPAGHYGFLPPCSPQFAANLPRLCTDPPGFDRTAFHRDFDASVVGFFHEHLVSDGEAR